MVLVRPSAMVNKQRNLVIKDLEDIPSGELIIGLELINKVEPSDRNIA